MIAGGAALTDILENLCDTIDAQASNIISTAMLMDQDGKRLWPMAGRRVPKGGIEGITPVMIGPRGGSCGTPPFRRERVITSGTAPDPFWIGFRDIPNARGLGPSRFRPLLCKD